MPLISLEKLHPDSRNANVCSKDILKKLAFHMKKSQYCPSVLVRPHLDKAGEYLIVDGHHRVLVAKRLGWTAIDCQIREMTEQEAGVLLLTLNRNQ